MLARPALPALLAFLAGCTIVNGLTVDPGEEGALPPSSTLPEVTDSGTRPPREDDGGAAKPDDDAGADAAVDARPGGPLRVFVTSSTRNGRFGGVAGADAYCQSHAVAAGLGGSWTAWVSTAAVDAIDRITGTGPWLLVDGVTVVAENKARLSSGAVLTAIQLTEKGDSISATNDQVWSATGPNGRFDGPDCGNWNEGGSGRYGEATESNAQWTNASSESCANANRLYCFEK